MPSSTELKVSGLARLSTCDWPGELVATLFCQGCLWNCAYCHNPHLRPAQGEGELSWKEIFAFLESRRGLLDGVVFSGGEPLLQSAIAGAVQSVRRLGFRIGLHTSGALPERLSELLPWVDWVGFDVKATFHNYAHITGAEESGTCVRESLRLLIDSGVDYEVRTTVHPTLLGIEELLELRDLLLSLGVKNYAIQRFRPDGVRMDLLPPLPEVQLLNLPSDFGNNFCSFLLR
jgi:pyruvate formate lyase activating enzyme